MAASEITDADQPDPDGSDDATGAPDSEISEATSAPDAFGDEAPSGSDDGGGDEQSSDDAGGSGDAGTPVDSGSDGATGAPIVDASTDPPTDAYDSGIEASTPADAGSMRDSGASRPADSGSPWSVAVSGGTMPGGNVLPASGDDGPTWDLDASFGGSSAWEDGGGGAPDLGTSPSRAVLGCAGCAVPDAGGSGTAAWLLVAVGLGARVWRRRHR